MVTSRTGGGGGSFHLLKVTGLIEEGTVIFGKLNQMIPSPGIAAEIFSLYQNADMLTNKWETFLLSRRK